MSELWKSEHRAETGSRVDLSSSWSAAERREQHVPGDLTVSDVLFLRCLLKPCLHPLGWGRYGRKEAVPPLISPQSVAMVEES